MSEQIDPPTELFHVDPEEVKRLFPSVIEGHAVSASALVGDRADQEEGESSVSSLMEIRSGAANRDALRKKSPYQASWLRLQKTGGLLVASFADQDEGLAAVRTASAEVFGDTEEEFNPLIDGIGIMGSFFRRMRSAAQLTHAELDTVRNEGPDQSFTLFKILAGAYQKTGGKQSLASLFKKIDDWSPGALLTKLTVLSGSDVPKQLAADLNGGAFDSHIAQDMLVFSDRYRGNNEDIRRLHRLGEFVVTFNGDEPDSRQAFYERLAAVVDDWPVGERNILHAWRVELGKSLSFNLTDAQQTMREAGFLSDEDPAVAFERSLDYFIDQLIPRQTGVAKAELLQLRTKRRTPRMLQVAEKPPKGKGKGKDAAATPEVRKDPIKLVSCNLQEGTTSEGVEPMVGAYLDKIGQKGSKVIREDVERILHHMARTDLPPNPATWRKTS